MTSVLAHWAERVAADVISREDKEKYVIEGGLSPSARKHAGSIREFMIAHFVKRILEEKYGKKVRFIYSWDAYDRLKKVSASIPPEKREEISKYIGVPQSEVPDPFGCCESYARHFEKILENEVAFLGVEDVEYIYQDKMYKSCEYWELIVDIMQKRDIIREIMKKYKPVDENYWPIKIYCENCKNGDYTQILEYDGHTRVHYRCNSCGYENEIDFSKVGIVKPTWRVEWAMRWKYYGVDVEPSGKDHMVAGSSYETSSEIIRALWRQEPPYPIPYEFVGREGEKAKMSSSRGNVITISDISKVYPREVIRFLYAKYSPSKYIVIPLSPLIFKVYTDFYEIEHYYFSPPEGVSEKEYRISRTVYEFCYPQKSLVPPFEPVQVPFRLLVELANAKGENVEAIMKYLINAYHVEEPFDIGRLRTFVQKAINWVNLYAPPQYKYTIAEKLDEGLLENLSRAQIEALLVLKDRLPRIDDATALYHEFFSISRECGISPEKFFEAVYLVLLNKNRGPRLAPFIFMIGKERVLHLLEDLERLLRG